MESSLFWGLGPGSHSVFSSWTSICNIVHRRMPPPNACSGTESCWIPFSVGDSFFRTQHQGLTTDSRSHELSKSYVKRCLAHLRVYTTLLGVSTGCQPYLSAPPRDLHSQGPLVLGWGSYLCDCGHSLWVQTVTIRRGRLLTLPPGQARGRTEQGGAFDRGRLKVHVLHCNLWNESF